MSDKTKQQKLKRYFGTQLNIRKQLQRLILLLIVSGLTWIISNNGNWGTEVKQLGILLSNILAALAVIPLLRIIWHTMISLNKYQLFFFESTLVVLVVLTLGFFLKIPQPTLNYWILLVVALALLIWWWLRNRSIPTDDEVRKFLEEDWNKIAAQSRKKLGLEKVPNAEAPITDSFVLNGLVTDEETDLPRDDIPYKLRKDGDIQYAANRIVVFEFTQHLIGVYVCDLNSLEPKNHGFLQEQTFECYYDDIVTFMTNEKEPWAEVCLARFNARRWNFSKLSKIFNSLPELPKTKNFILQEFAIVISDGQHLGTNVGVVKNIKRNGETHPDEVDHKVEAIRKMLRDKKKLGTRGAPLRTTTD